MLQQFTDSNLLDIDQENINIPPASFDTELTLPSGDFQNLLEI